MTLYAKETTLATQGFGDTLDLTSMVIEAISESGVREGLLCVFVPGSTAGVTTIEYEQGALEDLRHTLERLAPTDGDYRHNARWGDGNGFSHVRAAMLGPSLTVPVSEGKAACGTWQQIVLVDFDNRPRKRRVLFRVFGD